MKNSPSKDKIIKAAVTSYEKLGYEASSARLVAKSYKGAPGSIYYYFDSMEDLYLKAMQKYLPQTFNKILKKGMPFLNKIKNSLKENLIFTENFYSIFENSFHQILDILTKNEKTALKMVFKERLCIGQNNIVRPYMVQIMNQFINNLNSILTNDNNLLKKKYLSSIFDSCCISFFNQQSTNINSIISNFEILATPDNQYKNIQKTLKSENSGNKLCAVKTEKQLSRQKEKASYHKVSKTISDELL